MDGLDVTGDQMKELLGDKDSVDVDVNGPQILWPFPTQPAVDLYPDGPFCVPAREETLKRIDNGWVDDLFISFEDDCPVGPPIVQDMDTGPL